MIRFLLLISFFYISCSTLQVSEPATKAFADSKIAKADSVLSDPNATASEKALANDLKRSANLNLALGKQSAIQNEEIVELTRDSGWKDGLVWVFWVAVTLVIASLIFDLIKRRAV